MNNLGTVLARDWPRLWRMPEVWAQMAAGNRNITAVTLTNGVLRSRLRPLNDSQAFEALVSAGEFAAAAILLDTEPFAAAFSESDIRGMRRRLETARRDRGQTLEAQVFVLEKRAERLGSRAPAIIEHLNDARGLVKDHAEQAELALELVHQALTETENSIIAEIERIVDEGVKRSGDVDGVARWRAAVTDCINRGDWEVAERWARAGVSATVVTAANRRRRPWPDIYPARVALRWFAGDDSEMPRPPTFDREWGVKPGDAIGRRLVQSLQVVDQAEGALTEAQVSEFLDAVEAALSSGRSEPNEPRSLSRIRTKLQEGWVNAIVGRLRGIEAPGFYTFATADYHSGVPVLFTTHVEGMSADATDDESSGAHDDVLNDFHESLDAAAPNISVTEKKDEQHQAIVSDVAISLVYGPLPSDRPRESLVTFRATDVLRWIGDDQSRPATIRQTFGGRVPLRLTLPRVLPQPMGDFLIGRDRTVKACVSDAARILITGPRASGRSAIIRRLARSAAESGVNVLDARDSSLDPRDLTRRVTDSSQGIVVCDDLDSLPSGDAMELVAAAAHAGPHQRVVLAASLEFVWLHQSALMQCRTESLSRLNWTDAYEITNQLIEPIGLEFATKSVLDRFIYYTSGHPGLIHCLLWEICQEQDTGTRAGRLYISAEQLTASFESRGFREQVGKLLFEVLERHPALQVVLGALLLEQAGAAHAVSGTELRGWPELAGLVMSPVQIETALQRLSELWICDAVGDQRWRLSPTGIGNIVLDVVGDAGSYLETAVNRCARLSDGSLLSV